MRPYSTWIAYILFLLCVGCSSVGYKTSPSLIKFTDAQCNELWHQFQRQVNSDESYDAQTYPLPNHEYFRIDRFLASFDFSLFSLKQRADWLNEAYRLGVKARQIELDNSASNISLDVFGNEVCIKREVKNLIGNESFWLGLAHEAEVPDNYIDWRQWLGIYPVFKPLINYQGKKLNASFKEQFGRYEADYPWRYYQLGADSQESTTFIHALLEKAKARSALGLYRFSDEEQQTLFTHFAPVFEIEHSGLYDQPGELTWKGKHLQVKTEHPTVYTLLQHTRFNGKILPQLVYVIWFSERPKENLLDIYGGKLDGLMWRVTLDEGGAVLLYDSVHPCGCYYKLFPNTEKLHYTGVQHDEEALAVFPFVAEINQRVTVSLNARQHYVVNLDVPTSINTKKANISHYMLAPYDDLRNLSFNSASLGRSTKSMFAADGLVEGTDRLERFLLWNTGVKSPGAMRQWGNHATAFIGRRHFDDPTFLDRYFEQVKH